MGTPKTHRVRLIVEVELPPGLSHGYARGDKQFHQMVRDVLMERLQTGNEKSIIKVGTVNIPGLRPSRKKVLTVTAEHMQAALRLKEG